MIDVVFCLGNGSHWNDNELKYSLRSIEKHLKNYRDVYVIGNVPRFQYQNIKFIHIIEKSIYPAVNIFRKIETACMTDEISDEFLFFNDDHFLLSDFNATRLPYFYKGYLVSQLSNPTDYAETVRNTIAILGDSAKDFDIHTPIIYDKQKFRELMVSFDWNKPHGYCIKSLYCNALGIKGVYETDGKFTKPKNEDQLRKWVETHKIFSIDDTALTNLVKNRFQLLYPEKSKYEL